MRLSTFILFSVAAAVLAVGAVSGCRLGGDAACPIDAGAVLRDVKATDVQDPEVVAWTRDRQEAVVVGRREGMYAVIVAERYPASEASRWVLARVSIMRTDGDVWVRGDRDYDHRPTRADINAFLRQLGRFGDRKFVFKAGTEQDENVWQVEETKTAAVTPRQYSLVEPGWPTPPARVMFSGRNVIMLLEFSTDSRYLCAWLLPVTRRGEPPQPSDRLAVYDLAGKPVVDACDANGVLTGEYARLFPRTAERTPYGDFWKDAVGWGLSRDRRLGLRLVNARPDCLPAEVGSVIWTAELWQLQPERKRLWATEIPETEMPLMQTAFFERGGKPLVLLAFGGTEGLILSQKDGRLIDYFEYGHIDREWEQSTDEQDPTLWTHFGSFALSCDPARRWLACGGCNDRRVRIVSLDPPFRTVLEANTKDSGRGKWCVRRVEFVGSKYLAVEYFPLGRAVLRPDCHPTDIFDTTTGQVVWHENSLYLQDVTISPDDKKMALMRRDVLEIGDFVPQTRESLSKPVEKAAPDKIIAGRVLDVHPLGKVEEEATICQVDPRYVVVVQTENGLARLAIHSPAKTFSGEAPVGKSYRFYLSRSGNGFMLERVETIVP